MHRALARLFILAILATALGGCVAWCSECPRHTEAARISR